MSTLSKMWSDTVEVDYAAKTFDVHSQDGSAKGLMLAGTLVTASAADINTLKGSAGGTSTATIQASAFQAGKSGTAGNVKIFPTTASKGDLKITCSDQTGNTEVTVNAAAMGQATVYTLPDPGGATSTLVHTSGGQSIAGTTTLSTATITTENTTTANITNLKYGATPVPVVDAASCTITAAAGAANVSTVTIQLKDGSGTNMARITPFMVYSSSAADGLTLQSAASTGYSVASGGLSLNNGAAITTSIRCMSSATGGCVLSLTDTGKLTSYLVLVVGQGTKISAQLSAGSYG